MGVYEVGAVNDLVGECTSGANFLSINQENHNLLSRALLPIIPWRGGF